MSYNTMFGPSFLLSVQLVFCFFASSYIFSKDRLFGVYFLFLSIYAIIPQYGYIYFPWLSQALSAYFGEGAWYQSYWIVLSSLVSILFVFAFFRQSFEKLIPVALVVEPVSSRHRVQLYLVALYGMVGLNLMLFALNLGNLSWYTVQAGQSFSIILFVVTFKLMVPITLIFYCLARRNTSAVPQRLIVGTLTLILPLFLFQALNLGNRTDVLALFLGIFLYETYSRKLTATKVLGFVVVSALFLAIMFSIETLRYEAGTQSRFGIERLIVQDYFAPIHMLFAATYFGHIDPGEVIISNTSNALILLDVPFLQATITELFVSDVATRNAGYAFYALTEGYVFFGNFAFVYNAIVLTGGVLMWRKLARTENPEVSAFAMALFGAMLVNMVRGQSSYFIKYFYTLLLPAIFLYSGVLGYRIKLKVFHIALVWKTRLVT